MSDTQQPTELETLKERATMMGIKFSPNIGVDTLREKVNAVLAPEPVVAKVDTMQERYSKLRKEATKLIRVRIVPINPSKTESKGEYFRAGNRIIKTIGRFVPFEQETHVEQILLNQIKSRKYAVVTHDKTKDGHLVPVKNYRNEFQIEVLAPLTQEELKTLAAEQQKRGTIK